MNSNRTYVNNIQNERISEEVLGDFSDNLETFTEAFDGFELQFLAEEINADGLFPISGICDVDPSSTLTANKADLNEFDVYLGLNAASTLDAPYQQDEARALIKNPRVVKFTTEEKQNENFPCKQIPLSSSVDIGQPVIYMEHSYKVHIVYPLEEIYRPRYKSDYITLGGKTRKPRYVADRHGHHYITLQVAPNAPGVIRVDWLTIPDESGVQYSMPYRFQQEHKILNEPDQNPIYVPIETDKSGLMKLHLVLIKSKQDELKSCQPLKPFRPYHDAFGKSDKNCSRLECTKNPKQLIQAYHLEQSQLAFTFCSLGEGEKNYIPVWDTTDLSTVMTEIPTENNNKRKLKCPNCAHSFKYPMNAVNDDDNDNDDDDDDVQAIANPPEQSLKNNSEQKKNKIKRTKTSTSFMVTRALK